MNATMTRPVCIPFRWVGTRLDVRAYLAGDEAFFNADDICAALEFFVDEQSDAGNIVKTYPAEAELVDGIQDPSGFPTRFFTAATVRTLAEERLAFAPENGFLDWFDDQFFGRPLEDLADLTPRDVPDVLHGESFSVKEAASILSRDPQLEYGERRLFAALQAPVGWIAREAGIWMPTSAAIVSGHLIRHRVRVPGHKSLYPQVRITPAGLVALQEALGGHANLVVDMPDQLPLLEFL